MRYSKEHSKEVRSRLVREGARHVKEHGMQGAGVDGIARRIGLTGAALYTHFESKQDFLSTVLHEGLVATAQKLFASHGSLDEVLKQYMSLPHARKPATGCPLPALVADVSRSDAALQQAFETGVSRITEALGEKLKDPAQAFAVLAAAVGAVSLARALPDDAKAQAVLDSTRELIAAGLKQRKPKSTREAPRAHKKKTPPRATPERPGHRAGIRQ